MKRIILLLLVIVCNQSLSQSIEETKASAEQGGIFAQLQLGAMYYDGEGVGQDYAEAIRWYRLAAEQGDAAAQSNLGFMYRDGQGVAQNYAEALKWYRLAAEQGELCPNLGDG